MQKIEYTCDRCGAAIDPIDDFSDCTIDVPTLCRSADLCRACAKELGIVIGLFFKNEIGAEIEEVEE